MITEYGLQEIRKKKHKELCNNFHEVYLDKNDDYGDAFSKLWAEVGFLAGYTKIADKFYRVQELKRKGEENRRVNETIRDSLLDMANYCIMSVMEMDLAAAMPGDIVDCMNKSCKNCEGDDQCWQ